MNRNFRFLILPRVSSRYVLRAGALVHVSWTGDQGVPVEVEGEGGGGGLNKVFDGEAGSRGPTPYLIKKTIFDRKGTPFLYFPLASIDK